MSDNLIMVYEKWVERADGIYYCWRLPTDKTWHEKLTPYDQSPMHKYVFLTPPEFEKLQADDAVNDLQPSDSQSQDNGHAKAQSTPTNQKGM